MRWAGQEISNEAGDLAALPGLDLPGLDRLHNLVRSVRTPEFAGITFHEVLAKSALNHVPKAAGLPFNWTVNPYRGCSHGRVYYPEVLGTGIGGRDALSPPTNGTCRPSCRAPGDQHWNGPTSHRLDANSRGPFGAIVSADQAGAWLRLPSLTPPKEGCVETTPTPSVCHDWSACSHEVLGKATWSG
jgi:hypothetical protein